MTAIPDREILIHLIGQVAKAVPKSKSERNVRTYVTRPMWRAWCRGLGISEDSEPTGWNGSNTTRIYGSETIIVESDKMASVSFNTSLC